MTKAAEAAEQFIAAYRGLTLKRILALVPPALKHQQMEMFKGLLAVGILDG